YDSVWGNDHYRAPDYVRQLYATPPRLYDVLVVLSVAAGVTTRVSLGTAVLVLPLRDLVSVAKQIATLDQISGGRLLLGVGIGAYREEFEAGKPDWAGKHRGRILEEGLELLRRLFQEDRVHFSGEFYRVRDAECFPKPRQRPFPILVGGHQLATIDRAVRMGEGWIPGWRPFNELGDWIRRLREQAAAAGRDPSTLIVAPQFSALVAPTHEEAVRRYRNSGMVQHRKSLAHTGRDPDLAMENNLIGSPEVILEKLEILYEFGVDHLACTTFCAESVGEYIEQLAFFAEEVVRPFRKRHGIPEPGSPLH
ncbi:MAG: TIGR03619 family F420-dependent LLM class oxidoreductase, partial [Planifilum fulgidum]